MQQRAGCRRQVLRLLQHALRLQTPLQDLFPVLQLVNQRYRAAVESIPDQLLCRSSTGSAQLSCPNKNSARQVAVSEDASSGDGSLGGSKSRGGGATASNGGDAVPRGLTVGGAAAKGKARVALEQLVASVGDGTVLTERDVVLSVLYPYVVEVSGSRPEALAGHPPPPCTSQCSCGAEVLYSSGYRRKEQNRSRRANCRRRFFFES